MYRSSSRPWVPQNKFKFNQYIYLCIYTLSGHIITTLLLLPIDGTLRSPVMTEILYYSGITGNRPGTSEINQETREHTGNTTATQGTTGIHREQREYTGKTGNLSGIQMEHRIPTPNEMKKLINIDATATFDGTVVDGIV